MNPRTPPDAPEAAPPPPLASGNEVNANVPQGPTARGGQPCGDVADSPQAQQPQQPGGGGAPGSGSTDPGQTTGAAADRGPNP